MKQLPGIALFFAFCISCANAADESIDRLINKLPPPQKFVDPAISDPLAKQIMPALKAHNYGVALELSRKLAARYPKSLGAQMTHGMLAASVREFAEAGKAYKAALSIRPDFPPAYVGLGVISLVKNDYPAALTSFQRVTRAAPNVDIGWIGCSICAEKLGRKRDSLEFARRATAVAPSSVGAWLQAAREENLAGNAQTAKVDLDKANKLRRSASRNKSG